MVSKSLEGLYFVGASTRPGTGVPLVTIGARLVADRIKREVAG
jgi:phytoene dehydrogenase-like protein